MLFTWNPSPLRSSSISLEYLLLPPRSALKAVPFRITPHKKLRYNLYAPSYLSMSRLYKVSSKSEATCIHILVLIVKYRWMFWWCLSAIHFRGRFIRQVSCYTLLSGCRLPWPPSCCLDESTPFLGSAEHIFFGTLI